MYRATKQWFVNIDKLKDGILEQLKDVKFPNELNYQQMCETIKKRAE
jgi:isoleucyl-tRNA synthetase